MSRETPYMVCLVNSPYIFSDLFQTFWYFFQKFFHILQLLNFSHFGNFVTF
jgi:hypothetical protein